MHTINFKIEGMTCHSCVKLIQRYLGRVEGVENVSLDLDGNAAVNASQEITIERLQDALSETNYKIIR